MVSIVSIVIALSLICVAVAEDHSVSIDKMKEAALVVINDCKTKEGASDDDIKALKEHRLPTSKPGLCMLQCLFNTGNIMKGGKLDKEGAIEFCTPAMKGDAAKIQKMKDVMAVCEKETASGSDGCEVAKLIIQCTAKHGKDFGFEFPNHLKQ